MSELLGMTAGPDPGMVIYTGKILEGMTPNLLLKILSFHMTGTDDYRTSPVELKVAVSTVREYRVNISGPNCSFHCPEVNYKPPCREHQDLPRQESTDCT